MIAVALVSCEDTANLYRIKELEVQVTTLKTQVEREKQRCAERDKRREEILQEKLRGVDDVKLVISQLDARVRTIVDSNKELKDYISKLEQQLKSASEARAERDRRINDLNHLADADRKFPNLTLKNGKSYRDAMITSFGERGVSISHPSGNAQVPYNLLPDDLQRFQPPECPALTLPERPKVDFDAASDFSHCLPIVDSSQIQDEKLRNYLTQSNQAISGIAELRRDLAQSRAEADHRKPRDANLSAAATRDRIERAMRDAKGKKALMEQRLEELISNAKEFAKG